VGIRRIVPGVEERAADEDARSEAVMMPVEPAVEAVAAVPAAGSVTEPAGVAHPARMPASAATSSTSSPAAAGVRSECEAEDQDHDDSDAFHCVLSSCWRGGGAGGGSMPPCTPYATVRPKTSNGATSR